ncbi:MAG: sulfotransferase [Chromatocurvus sp.]
MTLTRPPFFVVGAQRSGTTMLRLMLQQHSELCVPFESAFIPEFYHRQAEFGDLAREANMAELLSEICQNPFVKKGELVPDPSAVLGRDPQSYAELIHAIFSELASRQHKPRWGDKTPGYEEEINLLWELFPGCDFVHLVRDGRDVAGSLRSLPWGSRDLIKSARDWSWKVQLGRKMGSMIPGHYIEVHYEDLVRQPRETLRRICGFLDSPFEETMLNYPDSARKEMPAASLSWHQSSINAPNIDKVQAWRRTMSHADQIVFDQVAGQTLELFGYERTPLKPTFGSRIKAARYRLFGTA